MKKEDAYELMKEDYENGNGAEVCMSQDKNTTYRIAKDGIINIMSRRPEMPEPDKMVGTITQEDWIDKAKDVGWEVCGDPEELPFEIQYLESGPNVLFNHRDLEVQVPAMLGVKVDDWWAVGYIYNNHKNIEGYMPCFVGSHLKFPDKILFRRVVGRTVQ